MIKSGMIGNIRSVEINYSNREKSEEDVIEYMDYPLMAISKILGNNYSKVSFYNMQEKSKNIYSKIFLQFNNAIATVQVSSKMKIKDELTIIGTSGYVIVEEPWWRTEKFEVFTEEKNKRYYFDFEDEGYRYELSSFLNTLNTEENYQKVFKEDSMFISDVIEQYKDGQN